MNCIIFFLKMLFLDTRVLNIYIFPTKCIHCIFFFFLLLIAFLMQIDEIKSEGLF